MHIERSRDAGNPAERRPHRCLRAVVCRPSSRRGHLPSLGGISHFDEVCTLDRSTAFARFGDWLNVYSENAVSFRKPPLQYWLTAILLELNVPELVALRAPSFVFALSGLAAIRSLDHTLWWSASKPGIGLSWWRSARERPPGIDRAARHRATPSDACHLGGRCGPSRKADGRAGRAGILCVPVERTGPEGRAR